MKMTLFAVVVLVAMVLFYAIHLGRGVKLQVKLPGTDASLEITDDQHSGHAETLDEATASRTDDAAGISPRSE